MELLRIARKLVSFNTVSEESTTLNMADFIAEILKKSGCKVESFDYSLHGRKKCNMVAYRGGKESHLALSGHMDTMPFNTKNWQTNPLKLTLVNDCLYGMGIADMKLFLAIAIKANELIPEASIKRPFALYFTSDEEIGCVGAKKLVSNPLVNLAKYIVVGEPTEMKPSNLHKGYMYMKLKVQTVFVEKNKIERSNHSSGEEIDNVVELAMPNIIQTLHQFRQRLAVLTDNRFTPNHPTMNIGGVIKMSDNAAKNNIPMEFTLSVEIRPIPGQDPDDLYSLLKTILDRTAGSIKGRFPKEKFVADLDYVTLPTPPMDTPLDSLVAQECLKYSGNTAPIIVPFNTEGGVFNNHGAQTVIWGPGCIQQAHHDNEFVRISWLRDEIVAKYVNLIQSFCCEEVSHE